jgi:hypothetical protein
VTRQHAVTGSATAPAGVPEPAARAPKTCPSSACGEGAVVLGVMTGGGRLAYLHPPVPVDAEFAAREAATGNPERRYRFAGPCVEGDCPQWTGTRCAIADMVAGPAARPVDLGLPAPARRLPACSIRQSCRWFFQRGPAACAVCPLIVADMGGTDTYASVQAEAAAMARHDPPGQTGSLG